ncbi:hypothetical protein [Moraxella bovoculi]|uniref:Uncharacterized protein n=1 Tax=Moraxella bovoculi 237 TaxID=743974 RepID=A0A066UB15_9GAMM|nr:hypothetical protein [Moraxella bovoculi]AKG16109.2 hypothetical protein AAX08_09780 [Moraxella bovoculi]KDN24295.1 hypothetical protein MBO_09123 [Moraxella bovoculi 237]NSM11048.1 hypothetical protein [Moraxella bovoculi]
MPALLLDTGEVITKTPLIIQAIAPQVYANTTTDLPNLPALSADSTAWGDRVLMSVLIWIGVRLPHIFETLSDANKQAVHDFHQSPLMQKLKTNVLENQPSRVGDL